MAENVAVYEATKNYGTAFRKLYEVAKKYPSEFPSGVIGPGLIAEYYIKKYLAAKYFNSDVKFGSATEKAWDIAVAHDNIIERYQVKSVSLFNKYRTLSPLVKGFDKLIVVLLDCDYWPYKVYMFDDGGIFFMKPNIRNLTVPDPDNNRRRGSKVFQHALDISNDFFDVMSNEL